MGTNVSKQATTMINETITDQSTRIMNRTDMYTESDVRASQEMTVNITMGNSIGCPTEINQNMVVKNRVYSKISEKKQQEITRELTTKLKNEIQNKVNQELKDLNLFQTNVSDIENYTRNFDYHDLSLRVSNALAVSVNSAIDASQKATINLNYGDQDCTQGGGIFLSQNIDIESIVENVVDSEQVSAAVTKFVKEVDSLVVNETTQKATGINPMMFLLFLLIIPIIIIMVILGIKGIIPNPVTWFSRRGKGKA